MCLCWDMTLHPALLAALASLLFSPQPASAETIPLWPDLAPGETTKKTGTALPQRPEEKPPITRVENITAPTLALFRAPGDRANGPAWAH